MTDDWADYHPILMDPFPPERRTAMNLTERDLKFIRARLNAYQKAQPHRNRKWRMTDRVLRRLGV